MNDETDTKAEIEVTEAMIEAGEDVLLRQLRGILDFWNPRDLAVLVYSAMHRLGAETLPNQTHSRPNLTGFSTIFELVQNVFIVELARPLVAQSPHRVNFYSFRKRSNSN